MNAAYWRNKNRNENTIISHGLYIGCYVVNETVESKMCYEHKSLAVVNNKRVKIGVRLHRAML